MEVLGKERMSELNKELCFSVEDTQEIISTEEEKPPSPWGDVSPQQWEDWHWQLAHRIHTVDQLDEIVSPLRR